MVNAWRLIVTHPKKTLLASAVAAGAYNYVAGKYKENLSRHVLCNTVKYRGFQPISPTQKLRRLTVFLNPFARNGSLLKDFEKNVAPILQLSGLDVQMVYTDNDAQVKDYVKVLDPISTDGILVASDDHVLQKVLTALLQRTDVDSSLVRNIPVGIVPLGVWNTFANSFVSRESLTKWCYDLLLPLLEEKTQRHNALRISVVPPAHKSNILTASISEVDSHTDLSRCDTATETTTEQMPTTWALSGLEWSVWRDTELGGGVGAPKNKAKPIDTNQQRGMLKPLTWFHPITWMRNFGAAWRFTWFWLKSYETNGPSFMTQESEPKRFLFDEQTTGITTAHKHRLRSKRARIVYTPACEGCSTCWRSRIQSCTATTSPTPVRDNSSMFSRLFGLSQQSAPKTTNKKPLENIENDRSSVINPECGQEHTVYVNNASGIMLALEHDRIRLDIMRASTSLLDHLVRSRKWLETDPYCRKSFHTSINDVDSPTSDEVNTFYCSSVQLYPELTENEFYWIDNDHFEACPIDVRVQFDAVSMYQ